MTAVVWLDQPTVTTAGIATVIEQHVRVGDTTTWESITVELVDGNLRLSTRGEVAQIPRHLVPVVVDAIHRLAPW